LFLERKPPSNDPLISRQNVEHRGLEHRVERYESNPKRIKTTKGEGREGGGREEERDGGKRAEEQSKTPGATVRPTCHKRAVARNWGTGALAKLHSDTTM